MRVPFPCHRCVHSGGPAILLPDSVPFTALRVVPSSLHTGPSEARPSCMGLRFRSPTTTTSSPRSASSSASFANSPAASITWGLAHEVPLQPLAHLADPAGGKYTPARYTTALLSVPVLPLVISRRTHTMSAISADGLWSTLASPTIQPSCLRDLLTATRTPPALQALRSILRLEMPSSCLSTVQSLASSPSTPHEVDSPTEALRCASDITHTSAP